MNKSANLLTGAVLAAIWSDLSQQMQQHRAAVLIGIDAEKLHAYRVALRKTRALLKLFSAYLPAETSGFARDFSWVSAATGAVRDLDVLLQFGTRKLPGLLLADAHDLAPVLGALRRDRERAQSELGKVLRSARYQHMVAAWDCFLQQTLPDDLTSPSLHTPVKNLVRVIEIEQCLRLLKAGRHVDADTPAAALHAMRIRIKRLRYLLDLMQPFIDPSALTGGRGWHGLLKPLARLQATLGEHQDAVATQERLRAMQQHPLQNVVASKILQQWLDIVAAQQQQARAELVDNLRKFAIACGQSI